MKTSHNWGIPGLVYQKKYSNGEINNQFLQTKVKKKVLFLLQDIQ